MTNDMPTPYYGLLYQIDRESTAWAAKHTVPRVYLAADVEQMLALPTPLPDPQGIAEARDKLKLRLEYSLAYAEQMHTALLKLVTNPNPEVHRVAFHALMPVAPAPVPKLPEGGV